ncbi:DUF1801 domain-containing protein [Flavobacterium sp. CAU 1735]|uniref:DUF1801 domain-containing protein n=1 Tax=Flavobacterium sp. CAU 1735 TaxID=3140361 RepID=UPI003261852C
MAAIKTKQTDADVHEFIDSFAATEQKKQDSYALVKIMQDFTGFEPKMWGPSIIGFGRYHYKSERSRQEADWPLVGFSPRKAALSLYIHMGNEEQHPLLEKLGKCKISKGCIYVKKLADIDIEVVKELMGNTILQLHEKYGKL